MTTDTAAEKKTLPEVLADLQNRFGIDHVMVVSDRGLVSPENLEFLSRQGFRYLLGIAGRRGRESASVLKLFRGHLTYFGPELSMVSPDSQIPYG